MEILKILNTSDAVNMLSGNYMEVISKYLAVAAIPVLIIALINCFFGQKLFKFLVGIAGVFIGAGLGAGICIGFNLLVKKDMPNTSSIVLSVVLGIVIFGFISFKLYKAGAFCMGFLSGVVIGISAMKLLNKDDYVIAAVIGGLLMGLLAIDLYKHMVIILTSVNGGLVSAACIAIITTNDDPMFLLKLGIGLAIVGIIFQYILSLFGKRKKNHEDEDDEDEEDEKQEKRDKTDKRVTKAKQKKNTKKRTKHEEKTAKKKVNEKAEKNANKKAAAVKKKKENDGAGFFLIDIIIEVAQGIKDRIVRYLNADDIEDDEDYDDEDSEQDEEDEDYEYDDNEEDEEEEAYIEEEEEDNAEIEEDDKEYQDIDEDEEDYNDKDNKPHKYNISTLKEKEKEIDIKEKELANNSFQNMEEELTRKLEENINIPLFDVDEIGAKLEEELENNLKNQSDEELENLIINQTIKDIDL